MAQRKNDSIIRLSTGRKVIFTLILLGGFLFSAETLLGLSGVLTPAEMRDPYLGFCTTSRLFHPSQKDGQPFFETAGSKLLYFNPQSFPQEKPQKTRRVFCLGGSTTFGRPYDDRTSYVSWLRESLRELDSSHEWEVINAGGISYASYRLLNVAEEIIRYEPDLLIIHTGHNEFLEKRTYPPQITDSTVVTKSGAWLSHSRIVGLFDSLIRADFSSPSSFTGDASARNALAPFNSKSGLKQEVDAILDHSVGPDAYRLETLQVDQVVNHFEQNLIGIIKRCRSAGADVLLVTPVSNLRGFSPFKSQHEKQLKTADEERWVQSYLASKEAYQNGDLDRAEQMLKLCEVIDSERADVQYLRGKLYFDQGEVIESKRCFESAVNLDVCPLRATNDLQRVVREVAAEWDVPLVDLAETLESHCQNTHGHTILGDEYFLDHVHPKVSTHGMIAEAILETMRIAGDLDYSEVVLDGVINRVGVTIQQNIDQSLQAQALTNLAQVLSWAGKQSEAAPLALKAIEIQAEIGSYDPDALFYAATQYAAVGQDSTAIDLMEQVLAIDAKYHEARWRLAALLYDQEEFIRSVEHYRIAVATKPNDGYLKRQFGFALLRNGKVDEAGAIFREYLAMEPGDAAVINQLKRLEAGSHGDQASGPKS